MQFATAATYILLTAGFALPVIAGVAGSIVSPSGGSSKPSEPKKPSEPSEDIGVSFPS
jgi:hypothetical protein